MVAATAVMAVVVYLIAGVFASTGAGPWAAVILGTAVGIAAYWAVLELTGVREVRELSNLVGRR